MKKIAILFIYCFVVLASHAETKKIVTIKDGNVIVNNNYIEPFYVEKSSERRHEEEDYHQYQREYIYAGDYVYDVKISTHSKDNEDYDACPDSVFSRIDIECIKPELDSNNQIVYDSWGDVSIDRSETYTFIQDSEFTAFTWNGFGVNCEIYKEQPSKDAYRKVLLDKKGDKVALVFRGAQYGTEMRDLSIILLYKGKATLVYNMEREICNIIKTDDSTTFVIDYLWSTDIVDDILPVPELHNLVFANGEITIDE